MTQSNGGPPNAAGKAGLLALVDQAIAEGWSVQAVCEVLKISRRRVERWQARCTDLTGRRPGGVAVNSLLDEEIQQIVAVFDDWGERDRSHRRHRGSYMGRIWASPSTVRGLIESDKHFRPLPKLVRGERRPFPDWASYRPNPIWIYDTPQLHEVWGESVDHRGPRVAQMAHPPGLQ